MEDSDYIFIPKKLLIFLLHMKKLIKQVASSHPVAMAACDVNVCWFKNLFAH